MLRESADRALLAVLRMMGAVARSRDVQASEEATLLRESALLRGYRLRLCAGLHAGWAVEGGLGSNHKVDAAYWSAGDTAGRLRAAAAALPHLRILLSHPAASLLSESPWHTCRRVGRLGGGGGGGHGGGAASDDVTLSEGGAHSRTLAGASSQGEKGAAAPRHPPGRRGSVLPGTSGSSGAVYSYDVFEWDALLPPPHAATASELASELACLPPLAAFSAAGANNADLFNVGRVGLPPRERCISVLGAADIIDHPIERATYAAAAQFGSEEVWAQTEAWLR